MEGTNHPPPNPPFSHRMFLFLFSLSLFGLGWGVFVPGSELGHGNPNSPPSSITPGLLSKLRREAGAGTTDARYQLGLLYLYGDGVDTDVGEAVRWFREAAKDGHGAAMTNLALLLAAKRSSKRNGEVGITPSDDTAVAWLTRAARSGDENAQWLAGVMYLQGVVHFHLPPTALAALRKTNEDQMQWGDVDRGVEGVEDGGDGIEKAKRWLGMAEAQGSGDAAFHLGTMAEYGVGRELPDLEGALQLYTRACERRNAAGCFHRALMLLFGRGSVQDFGAGREALRQSIQVGRTPLERAPAEYFLGVIAAQGAAPTAGSPDDGGGPDYHGALPWLKRAAASGHPEWAPRANQSITELESLLERAENYTKAVKAVVAEDARKSEGVSDASLTATDATERKIADAWSRHRAATSTLAKEAIEATQNTIHFQGKPKQTQTIPPPPNLSKRALAEGARAHPQLARQYVANQAPP